MRYREPFTIFPRKLSSGQTVFYYHTYDLNGGRTWARSTGKTTKTAAKIFCIELAKTGKLIPTPTEKKPLTLHEFAQFFWDYEKSDFLKYRKQRGYVMSRSHTSNQHQKYNRYIEPAFGKKKLEAITTSQIETWFLALKDSGYSHQSCNHLLSNLRTILSEAVRKGHLSKNQADDVRPLSKDAKVRGILTANEVKDLFYQGFSAQIWQSRPYYLANLVAATTGLRMGEIQALRWQDIGEDRINVRHSWDRKFGLKCTKTAKERVVPLIPALRCEIFRFQKDITPEGFVLKNIKGDGPIHETGLLDSFYAALENIGISEKERKERNITFHSWRHYFNTFLRRQGVHDSKVQMVTGHSSADMTEHYTHFDINDLKEVANAQRVLLGVPVKTVDNKGEIVDDLTLK